MIYSLYEGILQKIYELVMYV